MSSPAKLLIVGGPSSRTLARQLLRRGHQIDQSPGQGPLDAVVVTGPPAAARSALQALQGNRALDGVPVLALAGRQSAASFKALAVDEVAHDLAELERHIAASMTARSVQRRQAALLELVQVMTGSLDAEALVTEVLKRLEPELGAPASVVLLEPQPQSLGRRLSLREAPTRVDLGATQALRKAVASRSLVVDGQMLVQPLLAGADVPGALQVLAARPLEPAQLQWLQAVAGLLAPALRNARQHENLARQQRSLEAAYVERYRELLDANQRLQQADRLKDELLGIASHDVRAPLQVMLGHGRILLDSGQLTEEQRHSVDVSVRMSRKILELVEGLLEKSRGPDDQLVLVEPRRFDVAELCRLTVIDLQILAQQRGVALRAEAPESVSATGDVTKLRQVLQNLITNALDHARFATNVVVRAQRQARPDGDVVRVSVDDDGPGLDSALLPGLFDRFRQGGRGLAICRELVELHGGEVWAENLPGKGARFIFTVPVVRERKPAPLSERPLVLVVDDDRSWAEVLSMALGAHYRVEVAHDGEAALQKVAQLAPTLIVSDVFMPRLDGMQLLARLRERAITASVPVVLMTGDEQLLHKVKGLGAAACLAKPFDLPSFVHRVDELIQRSQSAPRRVGTDRATGLYDHLGLVHRVEQEVARSARYGRPLSVLVLKPKVPVPPHRVPQLASAVVRALRMPDVAAHLGEGTFAVVLPETAEAGAQALATRLVPLLKSSLGDDYQQHTGDLQSWRGSAASLLERLLA